ncbi:MAG: hypothetical protein LBT21_02125 [Oscillospiraceae bacterium]|jgi:hypothetical protein|nr:hypothetical protein [Oscillospiraceae bacterium]
MKKLIAALCAFVVLGVGAIAWFYNDLDVIGQRAVSSYGELLEYLPQTAYTDTWQIKSPDGSAEFCFDKPDSVYSGNLRLSLDAQPFVDAGLDSAKSPYETEGGRLIIYADIPTPYLFAPNELLGEIFSNNRDKINYHAQMDHFGIKLGGGNMFEWAKNMSTNDKDLVFALNPEPLTAAGVDPENVAGWAYAQVPMEEDGKMVEVWKLLKAFDLEK